MKKLNKYQLTKISKNLDYYFDSATGDDMKHGLNWYNEAHEICKDIAQKYNSNTLTVAQVMSALSPRNKWEQNIKDTKKVFQAIKEGLGPESIRVCTFHSNKFKAYNIINSNTVITDKSLKTYNFVYNMGVLSPEHLTVDIWHLRACFRKSIKIDSANIGRLAYEQIKSLTIKKANKIGLTGYQYQAVIWSAIRNN